MTTQARLYLWGPIEMSLRKRGEAHLLAGEYELAIPLLLRSITTDRQDDFKQNANLAAAAMMLLDDFSGAEVVLQQAEQAAFATCSTHRHLRGLTYWFRQEYSTAVEWFWRAGKAGYQNLGWRMCLLYGSIRQPQLISQSEIRACFQPKLDQLKRRKQGRPCDEELKLAFALGELTIPQFEDAMRALGDRYRRPLEMEMECALWTGLDDFLNREETRGIQRLLQASRSQPGVNYLTDEMTLARLELQRLEIDPITGRSRQRTAARSKVMGPIVEKRSRSEAFQVGSVSKRPMRRAEVQHDSAEDVHRSQNQAVRDKSQDRSTQGSDIGGFLDVIGIVGSQKRVDAMLQKVAGQRSVQLTARRGRHIPTEHSLIRASHQQRTCLLLPPGVTDVEGFSREISKALRGPVLWCHVHDGDFWRYVLFDAGAEVDRFVPLPRYWGPQPREEVAKAQGEASRFVDHWPDVAVPTIKPYLRFWKQIRSQKSKAHHDDAFGYHDCRQLVDFLGRLKLWIPSMTPSPDGTEEAEFRWSVSKSSS